MIWYKKSDGTTLLDKLQRLTPTFFGLYLGLTFFSMIILDKAHTAFFFFFLEERLGMWALVRIFYMTIWAFLYIVCMLYNLIRRYPIYPIIWMTGGFILLLCYIPARYLDITLDRLGGWNNFVEAVSAGWDVIVARLLG